MNFGTKIGALLAAFLLTGHVAALPSPKALPQYPGTVYCNENLVNKVTSKTGPALSPRPTTATATCPGQGGDCTLVQDNSYTLGVSITIGAELTLDPESIGGNAGLGASVSYTTLKGTTAGASLKCPEGAWTCGVAVTPWVYTVSGVQTTDPQNCGSQNPTSNPFTMLLPVSNDGLPEVQLSVCSCPNMLGWADNGAPYPCPTNCGGG